MSREAERVERARKALDDARERSEAVTPGGLHGDPATLSGVRRRGGHRQQARREAAYDREAEAARRLADAERDLRNAEAAAERAEADAAAPCDLDSVGPGDYVRDRHGWHRVVRVSVKSVTVETPWTWTERIPRDRVIETAAARRPSTEGAEE